MTKTERIFQVNDFGKIVACIWRSGRAISVTNLILKVLQSALPISILFITKELVDLISKKESIGQHTVVELIIYLLVIQLVNSVVNNFSIYLTGIQQQLVTDHLSKEVIKKAIEVELEYYENPEYHNTLHLAQHQALYKAPIVVNTISQLIESTISILLLSALFFSLDWVYAVSLVIIAIPIIIIRWYNGKSTYLLEKKSTELERQSAYLNLVLTTEVNAKEVRAFGFGSYFLKRFSKIRELLFHEKKELNKKQTIASLVAQVIEIVVISLMYLRLAMQTIAGAISIGGFILYFSAFQRLQSALKTWLTTLVQLYQSQLFLSDIFSFLDMPSTQIPIALSNETTIEKWDKLEISNLSFAYPNSEKSVLQDINFSCESGNIIAFVGENGSGKSTLAKLLCRLYDTDTGGIFMGKKNIQDIPEEEFRKNVSVVFQDFGKYYTSISENIRLGFGEAADETNIVQSAISAGAHEFIVGKPLGYNTVLGRSFINSEELSGGQWQKLAIARAFYRSPQILVLDEPTSHIDPVAEYELFKEISERFNRKIVILITHRLHNLKIADHIYVMHEGRIVENGTFTDLVAINGIFKEMFDKQQL
ncbi:MAG: ABC transporter ATP-binding protein [Mariniphaga sp.]